MTDENSECEHCATSGYGQDYAQTPGADAASQDSNWRSRLSDRRLSQVVLANCTTTLLMRTKPDAS